MTIQDVTIVGNICSDVELRYTPQGTPVAQFNVAVNDRRFNSETNQWENGDATFYRVSAWKQLGEHASETLAKGMEVIVKGRFTARNYTTREGAERTALEVTVNPGKGALGPSLMWMVGSMSKAQQGGGQQAARQQDPWNSAPQGGFSGGVSEPPF